MNTENRNNAPSELKKESVKQIVFMTSTLIENVFWEIQSDSLISLSVLYIQLRS
jgi:ribosomal protein S25